MDLPEPEKRQAKTVEGSSTAKCGVGAGAWAGSLRSLALLPVGSIL
jgi:hypothetical protein